MLKAALDELSITESWFDRARPGADPHLHRGHVDSFYLLEGELAFLVDDIEHVIGPGACVCAPPGLVHGFRSLSPARFLNFHTPDGGFAPNLRSLDGGDGGGFDSFDAEPGSGLAGSNAVVLHAGDGERRETAERVATIKVGRKEFELIEFELRPSFVGPELHTHDDHTDAFYVLDGTIDVELADRSLTVGAGAFVAAPRGVAHTFRVGASGARMLNLHAPGIGFHERLAG